MNAIIYLLDYAKKNGLLPMTGRALYHLQSKAYALPEDYTTVLDMQLREKFNITLEQWHKDTKYMQEHYYPVLKPEHMKINTFIRRYANTRGAYPEARLINYLYSRLNNAVKDGQIKRERVNGQYLYTI